jgi:N-acetylglucosamine kinase-like BadF-type ATPase
MSYFLALDAGGTKTDYILADEQRELVRVRSGTIKRMRVDAQTAATNLDTGLQQLSSASGVEMRAIDRTCIGTAGESVRLVADWLCAAFAQRVAGELILVGDVEIALDAAFPGEAGVLVLAGTGSNVAGRGTDGKIRTTGGWGPALADQGSGHRIGLEALRSLFLARDEGRSTLLFNAVLDFWKMHSSEDLIGYANALPAPDFSLLTPLVLHCAQQGDMVAAAVLQREGEALGYLVRLMLRRLHHLADQSAPLPPIAFAGSIMENAAPVRDALIAAVKREFPGAQTRDGVVDPIQGALWRARVGRLNESIALRQEGRLLP